VKTWIISRSSQDCSNSRVRTLYIHQTIEGNSRAYRLLKEIYQRICAYHSTNEKVTEEGNKVLME
jgi:hypothetical protein